MKIKSKLMISFLIIILVPVLLSCAVLAGFHNFQIKAMKATELQIQKKCGLRIRFFF